MKTVVIVKHVSYQFKSERRLVFGQLEDNLLRGFQATCFLELRFCFISFDCITQHNRSVYRDMAGVSGKVVSSSGVKREDVFFYDERNKKKYRMGKFLGKVFLLSDIIGQNLRFAV